MSHRIAALLLVLFGCSVPTSEVETAATVHVGLSFAPEVGIWADADAAVDRITAATGVAFESEPGNGGIAIQAVWQAYSTETRADGTTYQEPVCGITPITYDEKRDNALVGLSIQVTIRPDADCWSDRSRTIEHEMIHVLRAERLLEVSRVSGIPFAKMPDDHTRTGLFQASANEDWQLDAASLVKVCDVIDCPVFNVER